MFAAQLLTAVLPASTTSTVPFCDGTRCMLKLCTMLRTPIFGTPRQLFASCCPNCSCCWHQVLCGKLLWQ